MAVIEMSNRERSGLRLVINLLDGGSGLQPLASENRQGETEVLRDAEPQHGGTLRLAAKQARIFNADQQQMHADARRSARVRLARLRQKPQDRA
jgi:hypothetical protein